MLCKHISVEFQDIFTTPKENPLPKSMLTPHSPPICSLSLFTCSVYFVYMPSCPFPTIWCSRSLPLPLNIFFMRLLGSPCFLVFLTLISEHWRSRARSYTSPCLCPYLVPDWLIMVLSSIHVSPARTLRRTPDSHILLSAWHLSTWPVTLVRIKTEPLTFPTKPALPDSCQVLLRSPPAENLTAFILDTSLSFLKKCILFIYLGCAGSLMLGMGFL